MLQQSKIKDFGIVVLWVCLGLICHGYSIKPFGQLLVVNVDLVPLESFCIYCNNIFALQIYIHSQLCTVSKHTSICSPSIHHIHDNFIITKIYNPKYNVKKYKQNYNSFLDIFNTIDDSHIKLNMEINGKVCISLF